MADAGKKGQKKKRSTAKAKFHRKINAFNTKVNDGEHVKVLQPMVNDIEGAYRDLEEVHDRYVELFESGDEDAKTEMNTLADEMDTMYDELCSARKSIFIIDNQTEALPEKKSNDSKIKTKKLDVPTFSGSLREYPTFKRDYERHMQTTYGEDPYALRGCLKGDAAKTIQGVEDNYEEMFRRLDERYGCKEKLVDSVMTDLKGLKRIPDGDTSKFIKMIEVVERAWLDLSKMEMQAEMDTSLMISQVEKLLPAIQRREWAIHRQGLDGRPEQGEFNTMLKFLLKEKSAIEYMTDDLRHSDSSTKVKAHVVEVDQKEAEDESLRGAVNSMQSQMERVIEGLAQVAQAVSSSSNRDGKNPYRPNIMTSNNRPYNNQFNNANPASNSRPYNNQFNNANTLNNAIRNTRKRCWIHNTEDHEIQHCRFFNELDIFARWEEVRKQFACFCCLKPGHLANRCINKIPCPKMNPDNQICGKFHHKLLHNDSWNAETVQNMVENKKNYGKGKVILMISEVHSNNTPLTTLWDPGANLSLISKDAAISLGLKGRPVTLSITKVGNSTDNLMSMEYKLPLTDESGTTWFITVYELPEITADVGKVDVKNVVKLFKDLSVDDIKRPTGKVHLLIGLDWCQLMPSKIAEEGNIQLMRNQFGLCLRGTHPCLKIDGDVCSNHVSVNLLSGAIEKGHLHSLQLNRLNDLVENFMEIQGLGIKVTPLCGNCSCGRCITGAKECTIKEEREMKMIDNGLQFNEKKWRWMITFPWLKDPKTLPNNFPAALARMKSTERRLSRMGIKYTQQYNQQIADMVERKVARELTKDEIQQYQDVVHYIPHHEVLKPESTSTPMRIVFNSSSSYMGHALNDYWPKGPNIVNDLLAVLIRFRQYEVGVVGDIRKMYNAIELSEFDQHVHRFLWRDMIIDSHPKHYVMTALGFGDKPSGTIATQALRRTADMNEAKYPKAAEVIRRSCYVDDIIKSVSSKNEAMEVIAETERMLERGGFQIKHWISSSLLSPVLKDEDRLVTMLQSEEEKVLGMKWKPISDVFQFEMNFRMNVKGVEQNTTRLTPRNVLSLLSRIYDPLGLVAPYIVQGKILLRKTFSEEPEVKDQKRKWDMPISVALQDEWIKFFEGLDKVEEMKFKRCLKPKGCLKSPELVVFADSSEEAYGTCAYVRWEVEEGIFESELIIAKNRIAPKRTLSIPRLELCAAVIATRMRKKIEEIMDYQFQKVYHLTDSMIVRDQIRSESHGFQTFTAVRVGEIQENSCQSEWSWIPSECNPADILTRGNKIVSREDEVFWKNGPRFLSQPFELWPIDNSSGVKDEALPDCINTMVSKPNGEETSGVAGLEIDKFNEYRKLIRTTGIILEIIYKKTFSIDIEKIENKVYEDARLRWVRAVQKDFGAEWSKKFRRLGAEMNKDGVIVVGKRLTEWFGLSWNPEARILLPYSSRFSYLYVEMVHKEDHTVDATIAKVRNEFWIPKLPKLVGKIKETCITCRKRDKKRIGQEMGVLPLERVKPSPPFSNCGIDLFGPLKIRDSVKKRCHGKCYGVIFNCLVSRAVYLDITEAYSTDAFLICLRRFVAIRGYPQKIISDRGSQLICASKELMAITKEWDWNQILRFGREKGLTWQFTKSADAPWENGCSESLIRLTKRNLMLSVGNNVLTIGELQMVVFEIANLLNERPIGVKSIDPLSMYHLCPNDLLLGRASSKAPTGKFDSKCGPNRRYQFCQQIVDDYWKRWHRCYFDSLIIRQKWHTTRRNLCVGDIVLLQDSNSIRGNWKLTEVIEAIPGRDGKVRDVTVKYKNVSSDKKYVGGKDVLLKRSAHKLVLILSNEERNETIRLSPRGSVSMINKLSLIFR